MSITNELEEELQKLNTTHAFVMIGGKATIIEEYTELDEDNVVTRKKRFDYSEAEWKKLMANHTLEQTLLTGKTNNSGVPITKDVVYKIGNEWLQWSDRRTYKEYVFDPSWVQADKPKSNAYNTWTGFAKEPIDHLDQRGNVTKYWNFVKEVICNGNEEELEYIQKWCSLIFQKPWLLTGVALVLRGQEGIGKNTFVDPLGWLLGGNGGNFEVTVDMERMLSNFNYSLMNKILVFANEATWGGNKQKEGAFKALVTDTERTIEMKGKESFNVTNYSKLIIASNNEWCVSAGMDQRRLAFFNVNSSRKGDVKYWKEIHSFLKTDKFLEALLFDLKARDLTDFNARDNRPISCIENGQDVQQLSLDYEMKFLYEWLSSNYLEYYPMSLKNVGCKEISSTQLYEEYLNFCEAHNIKHIKSQTPFFMQMFGSTKNKKGLIPSIHKYRKKDTFGKLITVHVIPNITECRTYFEESFCAGIKQEWLYDANTAAKQPANLRFENQKLAFLKSPD